MHKRFVHEAANGEHAGRNGRFPPDHAGQPFCNLLTAAPAVLLFALCSVAAPEAPAAVKGLFYGGGFDQLWRQAVGAFAVLAYSAIGTAILALIVKYTVGLRLDPEDEATGIDEAEHAETAYEFA